MPRNKRRSTADMGPDNSDHHCSKRQRNTSTSTRRYSKSDDVPSFSQKRCISWFNEYTSPNELDVMVICRFNEYTSPNELDVMGPEGMEKFCEDIGVEPENVAMLVLAWKMSAKRMGYFTLSEWLKGLSELQCDSVQKVKNRIDYLKSILNDQSSFKSIYRYAYDFARDKDQRSMDTETAKAMLHLLLGKQWSLFIQFSNFLEYSKYKVINKDQWCNILEFSRTINNDLTNYDVDGAWPVMLDEFVDWLKLKNK